MSGIILCHIYKHQKTASEMQFRSLRGLLCLVVLLRGDVNITFRRQN